jgi:hypothetical protein
MNILNELIWIPWIICIGLLIAGQITGSKPLAFWGDIMLVVSFGVTAALLLRARSFWIGAAFAFPAIRQAYVLVVPKFRRAKGA